MAGRQGDKLPRGRPPSNRVRMVFAVDADLAERLRALPRRSDYLNRLLRANLAGED